MSDHAYLYQKLITDAFLQSFRTLAIIVIHTYDVKDLLYMEAVRPAPPSCSTRCVGVQYPSMLPARAVRQSRVSSRCPENVNGMLLMLKVNL